MYPCGSLLHIIKSRFSIDIGCPSDNMLRSSFACGFVCNNNKLDVSFPGAVWLPLTGFFCPQEEHEMLGPLIQLSPFLIFDVPTHRTIYSWSNSKFVLLGSPGDITCLPINSPWIYNIALLPLVAW